MDGNTIIPFDPHLHKKLSELPKEYEDQLFKEYSEKSHLRLTKFNKHFIQYYKDKYLK